MSSFAAPSSVRKWSSRRSEREREVEEAKPQGQGDGRARPHQVRSRGGGRTNRARQETERLEIQRQRTLELEEQERLIAVAEKVREQAESADRNRGCAHAARRGAGGRRFGAREGDRRAPQGDRPHRGAAAGRSQYAIKITTQAAAERAAAVEHAEAEKVAAEASRHRYEAEAEGQRKLNEAENLRSDASRRTALNRKLFEHLPAIIRESVKPMERIEFDQDHASRGPAGIQQWRRGGGAGGGGDGARRRRRRRAGQSRRERGERGDALPLADSLRRQPAEGGRDDPSNLSDLSDLNVRLEKPPAKRK